MSNQRDTSCWALWEELREWLEAAGIPAPRRSPQMRWRAYDRFRTGLSFKDVAAMLWSPSEDPRDWRRKSRGPILYTWWKLKKEMWAEKERREDELAAGGRG